MRSCELPKSEEIKHDNALSCEHEICAMEVQSLFTLVAHHSNVYVLSMLSRNAPKFMFKALIYFGLKKEFK